MVSRRPLGGSCSRAMCVSKFAPGLAAKHARASGSRHQSQLAIAPRLSSGHWAWLLRCWPRSRPSWRSISVRCGRRSSQPSRSSSPPDVRLRRKRTGFAHDDSSGMGTSSGLRACGSHPVSSSSPALASYLFLKTGIGLGLYSLFSKVWLSYTSGLQPTACIFTSSTRGICFFHRQRGGSL